MEKRTLTIEELDALIDKITFELVKRDPNLLFERETLTLMTGAIINAFCEAKGYTLPYNEMEATLAKDKAENGNEEINVVE